MALVVALGASPTTAASFGEWHRNDYGAHERLTCVEAAQAWTCKYSNADVATTTGSFNGRDVTDAWECPDWFAAEICDPDNLVAVYEGVNVFLPVGGHPFRIAEDYVITNIDGQDILYVYWLDSNVGPFYCPWFRTFQEALDAPFECTFEYL